MSIVAPLIQISGLIVLLLLLCQVLLLLLSSLRGLSFARTRQKLEREIFEERLKAVRSQTRRIEESPLPWNGYRKFRVDRKVLECDGVCSFYLIPHDNKALPTFLAGQYLTFEVVVPGQTKPSIRCYSLSDRPRPDYYRVTVKRVGPPEEKPESPPGVVSNYFHSHIKDGDILDVKAPSGNFHVDSTHESPLVLIGAGVGVTPILSMLNELVEIGSRRETWVFYGVRSAKEHIMKAHLEKIPRENENIRLHVWYSQPGQTDVAGSDYHHTGHITCDEMKRLLPSNNYDFFVCGPAAMMGAITSGLKDWGVPERHIHTEAFGHTSVKGAAKAPAEAQQNVGVTVTFARSGKSRKWQGTFDSVLEFALAEEVPIDSGCRAGNCGTCKTAIRSGNVTYLKEPGCEVESGSCLTCICVPQSELVLEA